VVAIAAGGYHSLALKANGTMVAWGAAMRFSIGWDSHFGQSRVPPGLTNVVAIAAGGTQSLALAGDGSPILTLQPVSRTAPAGMSVTLRALAAGGPPLSYQWQFNGTNLPGANQSSLTLPQTRFADSGRYRCVVSNALGSVTSTEVVFTVEPSSIARQPLSQTVLRGSSVTLRVKVRGTVHSHPSSYPAINLNAIGPE